MVPAFGMPSASRTAIRASSSNFGSVSDLLGPMVFDLLVTSGPRGVTARNARGSPLTFWSCHSYLRYTCVALVFSFVVAILIASRSISRGLAFAIFVGSTSLHGALADAFTSGLHAAFYASMGFMAIAAALSALRAGSSRASG